MLDSTGLTIKRLPEILTDIETSEKQLISADVAVDDSAILGQLNNVIGEQIALLWELSESVNSNFDKDKAEGRNLDDLGALIGVSRILASKSTGFIEVIAKDGVIFQEGAVVQSNLSDNRFLVTEEFIISATLCTDATLVVAQVLNNTLYSVTVNGELYSFTSDASATANEIVVGIKADIDADTTKTWTATLSGDDIIIATSDTKEISITSDSYFSVSTVTRDVEIDAEFEGATTAPANTITVLVSPITDVTSITNVLALTLGRLEETDEEYRARFTLSAGINGKATVPAIRANLIDVDAVLTVTVVENDTSVVDVDGLPPKSFEAIVQGGDDTDIATSIWDNKPAGIETFGSTTVIITDSIGEQRSIDFTRPAIINMAVEVTYTKYAEETFPDNGEEVMAQLVLDHINVLGADVDVIPQRMFSPIFTTISGIETLAIRIQTLAAAGDPPSGGAWQTTPIAIDIREFAQITLTDVTIIGP